jgi:hypothetical protein
MMLAGKRMGWRWPVREWDDVDWKQFESRIPANASSFGDFERMDSLSSGYLLTCQHNVHPV